MISKVTNITSTYISDNSLKLDWVKTSNDNEHYLIQRKKSTESVFQDLNIISALSYTDTTVDLANYTYHYRIVSLAV